MKKLRIMNELIVEVDGGVYYFIVFNFRWLLVNVFIFYIFGVIIERKVFYNV